MDSEVFLELYCQLDLDLMDVTDNFALRKDWTME